MQGQQLFPGVAFSESERTIPREQETAVPVFAGFTMQGEPGELREFYSIEQYRQTFEGDYHYDSFDEDEQQPVLGYAIQHYFENGGRRCFVLSTGRLKQPRESRSDDVLTALIDENYWQAVKQQTEITLLAIPDCVLLADDDSAAWTTLWSYLLAVAQQIGAHALLDSPMSPEQTEVCLESVNEQNTEYGSLYWPRLVTAYIHGQEPEELYINQGRSFAVVLPPSAAVAAVIGRVDEQDGIWRAPANYSLSQVIRPQFTPLQGRGLFNAAGRSINLIRSFPARGVRIWGCRTLAAEVNYDWRQYIQARRTLNYIQQALKRLCHFSVFEPNNAITWLKLKGLTLSWLTELWQKGGLAGVQAQQAFRVSVGEGETMTHDDVLAGLLIMHVEVALNQPAEFISLHLQFTMQEGMQAFASIDNKSKGGRT